MKRVIFLNYSLFLFPNFKVVTLTRQQGGKSVKYRVPKSDSWETIRVFQFNFVPLHPVRSEF